MINGVPVGRPDSDAKVAVSSGPTNCWKAEEFTNQSAEDLLYQCNEPFFVGVAVDFQLRRVYYAINGEWVGPYATAPPTITVKEEENPTSCTTTMRGATDPIYLLKIFFYIIRQLFCPKSLNPQIYQIHINIPYSSF